jgi:glycerophosphoryl diester phosphodiesterase
VPRDGAASPAISAHRGGSEHAAAGTYEAYQEALAAGADFVELDVRATADRVLVSCHRERAGLGRPLAALSYSQLCRLTGYEVPRLDEAVRMLSGHAAAHLDIKDAGCAAAAVEQAAGLLGPAGVLVTTRDTGVATTLKASAAAVEVGVTVGGDFPETMRFAARRASEPRLSRLEPVLAAGAGWAVVHQRLARAGLLAECRRRGLATMVWTVNRHSALARWLASADVDALVTDRPAVAVALRSSLS